MKTSVFIFALLLSGTSSVFCASPFGLFDFNLRGADPAAQIHSLDGIGFDGITMPLNNAADLAKLAAYQKAKPDLKLFAALFNVDVDKSEPFNRDNLRNTARKLASMNAKVWLIISGTKGKTDAIQAVVNEVADIAAGEKCGVSLYPHDHTAVETTEEMLVYLKKAVRPNLTVSVHQCHEMRAGNMDRIDAVMDAAGPYMDIVTICGSDSRVNDDSKDWSDAIKPLGEGDFDPKIFLRALKRHQFQGPVILHTFGLMKKPDSHYRTSFELYQKMRAEVDAEKL